MARIRTIKPMFFLNEQVAALPFEWRLLFIGLWTQADREGRLEDRPARLKASLFPYDNLDIADGLGSLQRAGLILRYVVGGTALISIPTWKKHQQPHIREANSEFPPPDHEHQTSTVLEPVQPIRKGREQEQEGERTAALRERFEQFWSVYPRKKGKDAAWREWLRRSPSDDLATAMIQAVERDKASPQWRKDGGEFIPHPRTWLHQGRWQDEADERPIRGVRRCRGDHTPPCSTMKECTLKSLEEARLERAVNE